MVGEDQRQRDSGRGDPVSFVLIHLYAFGHSMLSRYVSQSPNVSSPGCDDKL